MAGGGSDAVAAPPANDHYLFAQDVHPPGTDLPRDAVTLPPVDTTEATVQSDLFAPPAGGGPAEPTECATRGTAPYGRTVWYALYPDTDGRLTASAIGLDAVVAVVPFTSAADRSPQGYECANDSDGLVERVTVPVEAGLAYAVQIGGVRDAAGEPASGRVQIGVEFDADRDGDGVVDDVDTCPRRRGTEGNGCPPRIAASVGYVWTGADRGVRFTDFRVTGAPAGAAVAVSCSPRCGKSRTVARRRVTVIRAFVDRVLRPGTRLTVRVTRRGYFGLHQTLRVGRSDVTKGPARCLLPGSSKPRKTCR